MAQKLIVGNWKMNGSLRSNALRFQVLAGEVQLPNQVVVLVPFVYLAQAKASLTGSDILWGAQDVSDQAGGAFTGDVSAEMLADFACHYVLVGHSERRKTHNESDIVIVDKFQHALNRSITPILCIGETAQDRQEGKSESVVLEQLDVVLKRLECLDPASFVVAYEPVWAIGTGKSASVESISAMHSLIRAHLKKWNARGEETRILYGGSVTTENAERILKLENVEGVLVGNASLEAHDFAAIARITA